IAALVRNSQAYCDNTLNYTVTIKPLPNAEFEIGEDDQTSFTTSDVVSLNPRQSGGTFQVQMGEQDISKTVLQDDRLMLSAVPLNETETEKTIALKYSITQAECTNEVTREITISAQPGIAALNLITLSSDDTVTSRVQLQDEQTFPRSFFTGTDQFECQVSGTVNSVVFTYTSTEQPEKVLAPINALPYVMPTTWQPTLGTHTITAQAYSKANAEGLSGELRSSKITITDSEGISADVTPSEGVDPPQPSRPSIRSFFSRLTQNHDRSVHAFPSTYQMNQQFQPKPIQLLTFSAIAVFLSFMWMYAKPTGSLQPANTTNNSEKLAP
ncbi:hypothetical protein IQ250_15150, partial [Pseudanabaenaceae cyanobacterium LEGE 13415]|nr:hypothetical protein [Pseudanabaenaceae cyanobacterium LEGE 13415]